MVNNGELTKAEIQQIIQRVNDEELAKKNSVISSPTKTLAVTTPVEEREGVPVLDPEQSDGSKEIAETADIDVVTKEDDSWLKSVLSEVAKYANTVTIGEEMTEGTDVTDLIMKLENGVVANDIVNVTIMPVSEGVTLPTTETSENNLVPVSSEGYFVMDQATGRIYLATENEQKSHVEDTITLKFSVGQEVQYLTVHVIIDDQPSIPVMEQVSPEQILVSEVKKAEGDQGPIEEKVEKKESAGEEVNIN